MSTVKSKKYQINTSTTSTDNFTLYAPDDGTLRIGVGNADSPTEVARFDSTGMVGGGKVLQVLQAVKTDTFSTTSTSYADITGLSVSITPSSTSNKILIHYDVFGSNSGTELVGVRILRDATALDVGDTAGSRKVGAKFHRDNSGAYGGNMNGTFLDSPSSTSATTYKIQIGVGTASTAYVNRVATDTDNVNFPRGVSSITVMEIAG